jgi:hypothetical protein
VSPGGFCGTAKQTEVTSPNPSFGSSTCVAIVDGGTDAPSPGDAAPD